MGKLLFWFLFIVAVLFLLRLINTRKAPPPDKKRTAAEGEAMVRCAHCGVYLPRSEALELAGSYRCHDPRCHAA